MINQQRYCSDQTKQDEMGGAFSAHETEKENKNGKTQCLDQGYAEGC